ncbi:MAG: TIGR01777 family oxidoreductase [Acidimicrobiales bacterium]
MKVAITGGHGLIGSALGRALAKRGDEIVMVQRLGARHERPAGKPWWSPDEKLADLSPVSGFDAVVHLGGAPIASRRWNARVKSDIYASRIYGTTGIMNALASMDAPPRRIIVGSAIGFYGSRGETTLDENATPGEGFLAKVTKDWEEAALGHPIADSLDVTAARTGLVLAGTGGLLPRLALLFKTGLGGRLGDGRQFMSWIDIDDEVDAIIFLLDHPEIHGPVNLTSPNPVTNAEFTTALARALHRPAILTAPAGAIKALLGPEMANDLLFASQRVSPTRLLETGFTFTRPSLDASLLSQLGGS